MNNEQTNGTGNDLLPDRPDEPETLIIAEAQRLIKHIIETPIETDEQLSELGKIYTD